VGAYEDLKQLIASGMLACSVNITFSGKKIPVVLYSLTAAEDLAVAREANLSALPATPGEEKPATADDNFKYVMAVLKYSVKKFNDVEVTPEQAAGLLAMLKTKQLFELFDAFTELTVREQAAGEELKNS